MNYKKITETASNYDNLEQMDTQSLLENINREDQKVAAAVHLVIPAITKLVDELALRFEKGGRLFYIGAGTSGRLGILDASEIPPTFGMPHERVVGIIAGGDIAIRKAVENAEDNAEQAWLDLKEHEITKDDVLVGIAASGTTPYVIGGIYEARANGILTACITNNPGSPLVEAAEIPIAVNVGPEFVTGSTRMKSGTSQKLVLNMISTALMIKIGRVRGNKMVNMQLSNDKLVDRGTRYLVEALAISYDEAEKLLKIHGSVHDATEAYKVK
ncbi:N-acetylmuramic acid 6-phosphate etherase [Cellulophaga baltica]|uniref:N-acetylmuramic acid 6-phosphate etherase n=1 Tax=Cellulophaga baltica 18 TaxID=1348584 RepID=A0AAU8RIS7_9FLAO|nr:N-acetylmuramic acid 6-phosphate etherase [Cellulophaga baltica]AIY14067.1 N-acetylmuramic acid-6-phosphate etherase [Cellulophaga baltica NN016038]AIZ42415.1 N-acetylmuramic acid-6-phosphate etherase [Cellulophaga baltica 18]MBA6316298.1 N-acetylmuramic acid 6-phosphate etherase [Cellulophaga baltica]